MGTRGDANHQPTVRELGDTPVRRVLHACQGGGRPGARLGDRDGRDPRLRSDNQRHGQPAPPTYPLTV